MGGYSQPMQVVWVTGWPHPQAALFQSIPDITSSSGDGLQASPILPMWSFLPQEVPLDATVQPVMPYQHNSGVPKQLVWNNFSETGDTTAELDKVPCEQLADRLKMELSTASDSQEAVIASAHYFANADARSSRAMQLALESAPLKDAMALALGFRGHVRECLASGHGNYVIQKIIEVLPAKFSAFIVEELLGIGGEVSRHCFGCRVICRLLEHTTQWDTTMLELFDEILQDAHSLCGHRYGSFVVQHILEFGSPELKSRVASLLCVQVLSLARNRTSSRSIEKALEHCAVDDRRAICEELIKDSMNLIRLAEHEFGRFVVRALLRLPEENASKVAEILCPFAPRLKASRFGKLVAAEMLKRGVDCKAGDSVLSRTNATSEKAALAGA